MRANPEGIPYASPGFQPWDPDHATRATLKGLRHHRTMPQSLAAIYVHAVFSTKNRSPSLDDAKLRNEVHAYIGGACNTLGCQVVAVGGVSDHVHVLARLSRTISVSDWLKEIKRVSTNFVKQRIPGFTWQAGYGAFSVSPENLDAVAAYVRNQEAHHRKTSFEDEFRAILREHGVDWDERYVWD
jgi:putative transposase